MQMQWFGKLNTYGFRTIAILFYII